MFSARTLETEQTPQHPAEGMLAALSAMTPSLGQLCVLTGAGISTDSGIPDYRDEAGEWKRPPPMSHQSYVSSEWVRQRYWARSMVGYRLLSGAEPGPAHRALAELERRGRIAGVITQNVDRLHQKAGSHRVVDLHGRADLVRCMQCNLLVKRDALHEHLAMLNPDWVGIKAEVAPDGDAYLEDVDFASFELARCPRCETGIFKPDVVFFGDNVPRPRLTRAMAMLDRADALLVIGSSLMVFSGYRFARHASRQGQPVLCFNRGRTRADELFTLKHAHIDEGLETLLQSMPPEAGDY